MGHVIRDICFHYGVRKIFTSAYRPQADGIAEAFMKVLGNQLAILTDQKPKTWSSYLQQLEFAYRTTPHPSTGETPFFLMFGYDARGPNQSTLDALLTSTHLESTQQEAKERLQLLFNVRKDALHRLVLNYQKAVSKDLIRDSRSVVYGIGQLVLVKVSPLELSTEISSKLAVKWSGPYRVMTRLSNGLTYIVKDLFNSQTKTVHVGNTRPYVALKTSELRPQVELSRLPRAVDSTPDPSATDSTDSL